MDHLSIEQRSKNMQAVKSEGSKEEILLMKALWKLGHRYRKNNKTIFGKPDITFKKLKLAVFVDSEFFHGKDFETKKKPATNAEFWEKKITRNIQRDLEVNAHLTNLGWTVLRFWSTEVRKNLPAVIATIEKHISLNQPVKKLTTDYQHPNENFLQAAEPNPDSL